jgi:hypothetical protein
MFKFLLNYDKNNDILYEELCTLFIIFCSILLKMKNGSDKCCTENKNSFYVQYLFLRNSYILLNKVGIRGTAIKTTNGPAIHCTYFICWITSPINTHLE